MPANEEIVRMNLAAMAPDKRQQLRDYCGRVILRSLLPDKPSEQEIEDAKMILRLSSD